MPRGMIHALLQVIDMDAAEDPASISTPFRAGISTPRTALQVPIPCPSTWARQERTYYQLRSPEHPPLWGQALRFTQLHILVPSLSCGTEPPDIPWQGEWNYIIFKVPFNTNLSMSSVIL